MLARERITCKLSRPRAPAALHCGMLRLPNASPCALMGLALCLPMLAALVGGPEPVSEPVVVTPTVQADPMRGLWMRYEARGEGDPLRFWYFHGDGKGLYRYGKVGLANTHSFDYSLSGDAKGHVGVSLRFRKRGEDHQLAATIETNGQGTWLSFADDPREPGARYRKVESDLDFELAEYAQLPASPTAIGERMWIDYRNLATGGAEFHLYQLAATAIDGRGVGWFHRGDFDDWSTESLTYRIDGDQLELFFDLREEPNTTKFRVVEGARGRELWLDADPRDYWAQHRYQDGGRSFGTGAFDVVVGVQRWFER
jgi:hypothetical protein